MENEAAQRKPRNYKAGLMIVILAVLMLAMVLWIFDGIGASALDKAVRQSRAIGGPLTLEEVMAARGTWPDHRNGALVIVALQPQLDAAVDQKRVEGLPVLDSQTKPALGRRWSPEEHERVRDYLQSIRAELAGIDKLKEYEGGQFPIVVAANPVDTPLPHLSRLRAAARLKHLQMLDRAMRGESGGLSDDVKVALTLGQLVADEPTLISMLVGRACGSVAIRGLELSLGLAPADPEVLERVQELLVDSDVHARMVWAIRSERAFFMASADAFRRTGSVPGSGGGSIRGTRIPGAQGWIMRDEAQGLRRFNRLVQTSSQREMLEEVKKIDSEIQAGGYQMGVLTRTLFPSFRRALTLLAQGTAEMRCARVAVTAERYRRAAGEWPADLQRLVPDYIDRIPEDPFAPGKPLRLERNDDRLIVYSVGPDEKDDGGAVLRGDRESDSPDFGFILLDPAARNQAPLAESQPASHAAAP